MFALHKMIRRQYFYLIRGTQHAQIYIYFVFVMMFADW